MVTSTRARSASDSVAPAKRSQPTSPATPMKKSRKSATAVPATPNPAPAISQGSLVSSDSDTTAQIIVRPKLSFDYATAKAHLIAADPRFGPLMDALMCKPFEEESDLNPFRALCSSILGQQISWLAARSITHKFIRLVAFPELPEKPAASGLTTCFPTPQQVVNCPMTTLREAGLSQRKAEYVQDLAGRFSDGRLSATKLMEMNDEEVMKALIEVRGIGRWSVEMFSLFALRRPDVLPCGDLGVQKGLIRWLTQVNPSVHSRKLPESPATPQSPMADNSILPVSNLDIRHTTPPVDASRTSQSDYFLPPSTPMSGEVDAKATFTPSRSTRPPSGFKDEMVDIPLMTPRTGKIAQLPPFPECQTLTRESCKARLNKKIKGNIYLSPKEMEELTESWKPYRSIGVWYLW
ncbi:MAG: hypothetical protein CYPHOPRED_005437 [Cyphobasidiales sp. Tagirdzhanova-0007]|nr:MAG: hypothetical protein CYPHOPRED_005437 [Cyphobasidiales sp. Tagirdzhanova-0007]